MKNKKSSRFWRFVAPVAVIIALFVAFQFVYPNVSELKTKNPKKTAMMKYRETEWRQEGRMYTIDQQWVPLSAISPYVIKAVLIGEDDKFWRHEGFDYGALQKAIEKDIKARKFKLGASTISQQLAKNLFLSPSKSPLRKLREAIITWRMEKSLSKRRILELYLNVAEWGDKGIFGIGPAARHYYGKAASDLSAEEAVRLAAVLPNPRKYSPVREQRYVVKRANLIYSIMVRRGIVVPEYEEVREGPAQEEISAEPTQSPPLSIIDARPSSE